MRRVIKKGVYLFLPAVLLFVLAACGSAKNDTASGNTRGKKGR